MTRFPALLALLALAGCSEGCGPALIEGRRPSDPPTEVSTERAAVQRAIVGVAELRTVIDVAMAPRCREIADQIESDEGMSAAEARLLGQGCLTVADIDRRLVGSTACDGDDYVEPDGSLDPECGALQALELAADRYESTRDQSGLERVAPCIVALVADLEEAAQRIGTYDLDGLTARILSGLAVWSRGQCLN